MNLSNLPDLALILFAPWFLILSVLFWSWLWGIAGAFVAVPLLLGLRAVSQRSRRLRLVRVFLDPDDLGDAVRLRRARELFRERRDERLAADQARSAK